MKILHIDSGISPSDSISRLLTAEIVERFRGQDTSMTIVHRDLIADHIPYMNFRTMPGSHPSAIAFDKLSEEEKSARSATENVLNEFLTADVVVLGIPMYNFGIAAQLKSWFDAILIPGKTFAYASGGPKGLAGAKRVILVITRGGFYGPTGFSGAMEHAESYVRAALSLVGISVPELVLAEGIAIDRTAAIERGRTSIQALAPLSETA
jgi:FMN-dependent NADH-azoreductase